MSAIKKIIKNFWAGFTAGTKEFGSNMAAIISSVLLAFVYVIGVGATSIAARLFGKKFLDMKIEKERPTYWKGINLKKNPFEDYYRQF